MGNKKYAGGREIIIVDEAVVSDIQIKDAEARTSREILAQIVDMHRFDGDVSFVNSTVFRAYEKECAKKTAEYENAKSAMVAKYITGDLAKKAKEWHLSYYTCELEVNY